MEQNEQGMLYPFRISGSRLRQRAQQLRRYGQTLDALALVRRAAEQEDTPAGWMALAEELLLQYVRETGCALILVTHSLQQARRVADRVLYFHKGCLLESGSKSEVLDHPQRPETKHFLEFYGT